MSAGLLLVLVVVVAYVATHVAYDWIARRFLIVSGAEYLILGILIGPQVSGLVPAEVVRGFTPLAALTLGWVGMLVGTQFHLPALVRVPALTYRLAYGEALATLAGVTGVMLVVGHWLFGLPYAMAVAPAIALGAVACASTPAGIELAVRAARERSDGRGTDGRGTDGRGTDGRGDVAGMKLVRQLQHTTAADALVGIVAVGLLACVAHPALGTVRRQPTATEWAAITLGIGVVGGSLFHLFLGRERRGDRLFIALVGAVILASGTATYLRLSPLFTCLVVGVILGNTTDSREEIIDVLGAAERPLYYVLLIFAGMSWRPSAEPAWVIPALAYLPTRTALKVLVPRLATWWSGATPTLGGRWGWALLGQGGLSVALAFDYLLWRGAVLPNVVFTTAIISVLLTEFASVRLVRSAFGAVRGRAHASADAA